MDTCKNFRFGKFEKILIWKIPKIYNFTNSKKNSICKIKKIVDLENSQNGQFIKFEEKICNLKNSKNYEFRKFHKFAIFKNPKNFPNVAISKNIKIFKSFIFEK